jgi:hypothetical protein
MDDLHHQREEGKLVYGALAGAALVAVVQLTTSETSSTALTVAQCCFAAALPLLTCLFMIDNLAHARKELRLVTLLRPLSVLMCFAGMVGLFCHFGWVQGVAFAACSVLGLLLYLMEFYRGQESG